MTKAEPPVTFKIFEPSPGTTLSLAASPVRTRPVALLAMIFAGEEDVTSQARVTWRLSWRGTYRTYSIPVAVGAAATVAFETGGGVLRATAVYRRRHYHATVRLRITGTNPSKEQVAERLGNDVVFRALCWCESRWRQFDDAGLPLQPRAKQGRAQRPSARGVGQVLERWWAGNPAIDHNDYPRIAWQWDYCIDAARDILRYCEKKARKKYPQEDELKIWNLALKAYKVGESTLSTNEDPADFPYVKSIRHLIADRPWE
jgi:hypothetical protein